MERTLHDATARARVVDPSLDPILDPSLDLKRLRLGWLQAPAKELLASDARIRALLAEGTPASRQYLAMAMAAPRSPQRPSEVANLAVRIATTPRRQLLGEFWGADLGSPRLLGRLGRRIWPESIYRLVARILADPDRRALFATYGPKITAEGIQRIANAPPEAIAQFRANVIAVTGGEALLFMQKGLIALRPDLSTADIAARINQAAGRGLRLRRLVMKLLPGVSAPAPPWQGDAGIVPIHSVAELWRVAREFANCLAQPRIAIDMLRGDKAYYVCREDPCIVGLARHRLLNIWRLDAVRGLGNKDIAPATHADIVATFAAQGIPYLPESDLLAAGVPYSED